MGSPHTFTQPYGVLTMNRAARTAKLHNIRTALTSQFRTKGYLPHRIDAAVHSAVLSLIRCSNAQVRRFARLAGV